MKKRKIVACVMILILAFGCIFTLIAGAIWNEDDAVHIKSTDIENSTLIIGTHLIHLSALTNELNEIAQNSVTESGQEKVYYKSELANGAWFDISTASSLKDITTSGLPVANSVVEQLLLTHHTKSDGVTYDLRTKQPVSIYDIKDPYMLKNLEELFPLKTQYDLMLETSSEKSANKEKLESIRKILELDVENDVTKKCDANLKAMQDYYNILNKNKATTENMDIVQSVMAAEDALRRAEVFTVLASTLNEYSESIQKSSAASDTALQSAVNDSLTNVNASLIKYEGEMLSMGNTSMTEIQYEYSDKLMQDSKNNNHASCDIDVTALLALRHIENGIVTDKVSETSFLENTLLPKATDKYTTCLKAGENAEYEDAVKNNSASVVLKQIIEFNISTLNIYRNELESYITAKVVRLDSLAAKNFLSDRIKEAQGYYTMVVQDSFAIESKVTIDQHIAFLSQKIREIELGGAGNEIDKLKTQKEELKTQYLADLDKNDLVAAKAVEEQITNLEDQIKVENSKRIAQVSEAQQKLEDLQEQLANTNKGEDTGTTVEKLELQIGQMKAQVSSLEENVSNSSVGGMVVSLKKECIDIIGNAKPESSQLETLKGNINSLVEMQGLNYQMVFPALSAIHSSMASQRDLNGRTNFNNIIEDLDKVIGENKAAYEASLQAELSSEKVETISDKFFKGGESSMLNSTKPKNESIVQLSEKQKKIVYLQALQMYYEATGSSVAKSKLTSLAQQQINLGNPLIFIKINDVSMEYIPASAIASYKNMRYVWNNNIKQGTLAQGAAYYAFTVNSNIVQKGKGKNEIEKMSKTIKFYAESLYIPDEYANKALAVDAVYLTGTNYGIISSNKIKEYAEQLKGMLLQGKF